MYVVKRVSGAVPKFAAGVFSGALLFSELGPRKKDRGNKSFAYLLLLAGVLCTAPTANAQEPAQLPRVGFLSPGPQTFHDCFRQGLRDLGYEDGRNVIVVNRVGDGRDDGLPALARELVDLSVDVIVATNSAATKAAMAATSTIPIVMVTSADPIGSGFIKNLPHPGGNVTGLTSLHPELAMKQLQFLKETVPGITRTAILSNPLHPVHRAFLQEAEAAAEQLGLELVPLEVRRHREIEPAFRAAAQSHVEALLVLIDQVTNRHRAEVVELAKQYRLPAIYPLKEFVEAGGLMAYGVSWSDLYYRSALYVDKILRGAKPADLPVEQPTKLEMAINVKTAEELGITAPASLLFLADLTIE